MNTTVTGVFSNRRLATIAAAKLLNAGVPADQVEVLDVSAFRRHPVLDKGPATRLGVFLGVLVGATGGCLAGAFFTTSVGPLPTALLGSLCGATGGALLGLWLRLRATGPIRTKQATILVSVAAACEQKPALRALLAGTGGTRMVVTSSSFTTGVLPVQTENGRPE